uniref:Mitogen-activated protein kinase kinase kinase 7 n=1 Tax=Ascaris suum TaxID=6253 RepID=F1KXD8_ASCSU
MTTETLSSTSTANTENPFLEVDVLSLQFIGHLGRGTYGNVQKAKWRGQLVAVKIIENDSERDRKSFINEMKFLRTLVHPNIIQVYGACSRPKIALVMELMENGSMHDLLHVRLSLQYKADHVFSWSRQCAGAISYMHASNYVHRDLKPPNLLLKNGYRLLKVCDFGTVARVKTTMTNNRGSAAWMAPEVFSGSKYNEKCDVYSFGIMLWEMITRRKPFEDVEGSALTILWKAFMDARPPPIAGCPQPLMDLIVRCWAKDPNARPTMAKVYDVLTVFQTIFPEGDSELIDRSVLENTKISTEPKPVLPFDPVASLTLAASESSPNSSTLDESLSTGSVIPQSQERRYSRSSQSKERESTGQASAPSRGIAAPEDWSFSFLEAIDPHLKPVAPLSHRREDEELYLAQLMACKNLYELECELKCALREKHAVISRLLLQQEISKLKRKRNHLRSMLENSTKRINAQRHQAPSPK